MIKAANKYKAPRTASDAIKDFLKNQQNNIIKELKIGIKSYDFSKIKEKKDFTGFYGEVINTVILNTLNQTYQGTEAIQIGANKEF
jgi:Zn-dependent peptidase ImmA (M78 family)